MLSSAHWPWCFEALFPHLELRSENGKLGSWFLRQRAPFPLLSQRSLLSSWTASLPSVGSSEAVVSTHFARCGGTDRRCNTIYSVLRTGWFSGWHLNPTEDKRSFPSLARLLNTNLTLRLLLMCLKAFLSWGMMPKGRSPACTADFWSLSAHSEA